MKLGEITNLGNHNEKEESFFSRDQAEIRKGDGDPRNGENRGEIDGGERQETESNPEESI